MAKLDLFPMSFESPAQSEPVEAAAFIDRLRDMIKMLRAQGVPPLFSVIVHGPAGPKLGRFYALHLAAGTHDWLRSPEVLALLEAGEAAMGGDIVANPSSPFPATDKSDLFLGQMEDLEQPAAALGLVTREVLAGCANMHRQRAIFHVDVSPLRRQAGGPS